MTTARIAWLASTLITAACSTQISDTSEEVTRAAAGVQLLDDGSVIVDNVWYESMSAFHESDEFRTSNRRCASKEPAFIQEFAPTDCSLNQTSIEPDYVPADVYQIPTVFHIVTRANGTGDIPDALILSQIDVLNEDFRALPGTLGAFGTDTRIEFVLATTDPNGNPTSGINRYADNAWFTDPGPGVFNDMKQAINWDTTRYFNIYTNDAAGALGYAVFPAEDAGTYADGVVLAWQYVGRNPPNAGNYNLGRTATHETGHYLGLYHTFQDACGINNAPYISGDTIADTNPEQGPNFGCPGTAPSTCGSTDPIENYMDYSDDVCMDRFTTEQANRMRCSMIHYRPDLFVVVPNTGPQADFSYNPAGLSVDFMDLSSDAGGAVTAWDWDFGDGSTSTQKNPSHTFPTSANYTVSLLVTNDAGAQGSTSKVIQVGAAPAASFTYIPNGLEVNYFDGSTDDDSAIASWQWDFGDGNTSSQTNPTHTYATPGTYTVTLEVADEGGLTSTATGDVVVDYAPMVDFGIAADGLHVAFTDMTVDAMGSPVSWDWDFGDGSTSTETNPVHDYATGGTYAVTLSVTNDNGATGARQKQVTVNALPVVAFSYTADDLSVAFTQTSSDPDGTIDSYLWRFGDDVISTEPDPTHVYDAAGTYTVTLEVTDDVGGVTTATMDITVSEGGCGCHVGRASGNRPAWPAGALLFGVAVFALRRRKNAI